MTPNIDFVAEPSAPTAGHTGHTSDLGLVRATNEDSYAVAPDMGLWLVADGLGGHGAGEAASAIAVTVVVQQVRSGASLVAAIRDAHRAIRDASAAGVGSPDMGTTVVALKLIEFDYEIAWVGDSRAYLWNGALCQLTKDHSLVQLMLDAGMIEAGQASTHRSRHVVLQALGTGGSDPETVNIAIVDGSLRPGECILLCSDGLSSEVPEAEIARILAATGDNQQRVERLIDAANEAGGHDNVTVIAVAV